MVKPQVQAPLDPPNQDLAAWAATLAGQAPGGSLLRKAAGCLVVALSLTKSIRSARKVLTEIPLAEVRQAAEELLDELTHGGEPHGS